MNGTLLAQPEPVETPPPLKAEDQHTLQAIYTQHGVLEKDPKEKSATLQKYIQARKFFAFGGKENDAMELRVNERIYLLQHATKP